MSTFLRLFSIFIYLFIFHSTQSFCLSVSLQFISSWLILLWHGRFGSSAGCSKQICMAEYFWAVFGQLMSVYDFSALLAWGLDDGGLDLSHHALWQIPRNITPKLIQLNERSLNDKKLSSWYIKQINRSKTSHTRNMTGFNTSQCMLGINIHEDKYDHRF